MTFAADLKAALLDNLGRDWVQFKPGWDKQRRCPWQKNHGRPVALMLHHTAAAQTDSINPKHPGNQPGADDAVVNYIQNHYEVPAANCTLTRSGIVVIHSCWPIWHAGLGTFKGKAPWSQFGIAADTANDCLAGVEVCSKGLKKDWTVAQQDTLVHLLRSWRDASGWDNVGPLRRPRHVDWAGPRKTDPLYSNTEVGAMILKYGFAPA